MKRGNQVKLAAKIQISEGYLSQILNGKRRPQWLIAKKLAEATRTRPDFWLEGKPEELKDTLSEANFLDEEERS